MRPVMRLAFCAILMTFAPLAGANLIVNGDFSIPAPNPNGTLGGWTAAGNDGAGGWRAIGGNPDGHFLINDNGSEPNDPILSQTVSGLIPGAFYVFEGDRLSFAPGFGDPNATDFEVLVSGVGTIIDLARNGTTTAWEHFGAGFFANATSHTFTLIAEQHSDNSYSVDNISLLCARGCVTQDVPAPATGWLLAAGLLALGARRRSIRG